MTNLNDRNLIHTAVYWAAPTPDGYGGYTWTQGVEIDCRWSRKMERYLDSRGEEKISRAIVRVDREVALGGYLFLGDLDDLSDSSAADDPTIEAEAYPIQAFTKIANLSGGWYSRKVWL